MRFLAQNKDIASVEATPQHLTLAAPECYAELGTRAQMNPPIRDESHRAIYERLDSALTREIMRSVLASRHDQLVYARDLSGDEAFGQPGWQRTYPQPF